MHLFFPRVIFCCLPVVYLISVELNSQLPMKKHDLLRKYLDGKCSEEELQQLYAYLQEDAADEYAEILYEIWSRLDKKRSIDDQTTERIFGKIKSDIIQTHSKKNDLSTVRLYMGLRKPAFTRVAAAVTVLLTASALLYRFLLYEPMVTIGTGYGTTNTFTLPDGSVVSLYANSKIKYPKDWSSFDQREVWLEGEAFFTVEKRLENQPDALNHPVNPAGKKAGPKHKKFTVHTSNLDIEVIGTRFNVKDRRGEIQVVLNTGQIKLKTLQNGEHDRGEYLMEPGDLAHVGPERQVQIKKVEEPDLYSLWKKNELYFENQSLREIGLELYDSHGVQIQFENREIANLRFTGSTPVNDLQILFTTIQKSFDLEVIQRKNEIMLKD